MTDRCSGTGQRTLRPYRGPDLCPVCQRVAYVRLDGTTGSHPARKRQEPITGGSGSVMERDQ